MVQRESVFPNGTNSDIFQMLLRRTNSTYFGPNLTSLNINVFYLSDKPVLLAYLYFE